MKRGNDDAFPSNPIPEKKPAPDDNPITPILAMMETTNFKASGFLLREGQFFSFYECKRYKAIYAVEIQAEIKMKIVEADTLEELLQVITDEVIAVFYYFPETRLIMSMNPDGVMGVRYIDLLEYSDNAVVMRFPIDIGNFKELESINLLSRFFALQIQDYNDVPIDQRDFNKKL